MTKKKPAVARHMMALSAKDREIKRLKAEIEALQEKVRWLEMPVEQRRYIAALRNQQ